MDVRKLFVLSDHALTKVVDQIIPDDWKKIPDITTYGDKKQTLREIVNYHAYDDAWVPDVLAGETAAEVGTKYDGDLLGDDTKKNWHEIEDKAVAAVEALSDEDLNKVVHLSYGDFPAKDYLWHIATFRVYRAIEIAQFLGVDDTLPEELVSGMYEILKPNAAALRQMGVFKEEIKVAEDAPLYDKLLALSGRSPKK